jgi:hypothetical protein
MTAVTDFQYGMKERGEVAVVKLHAKMCQGLKGIEALTAGAQVLTCVGETEDGGAEELTEWRELLQNNNEQRGGGDSEEEGAERCSEKGHGICSGHKRSVHHIHGSDARGLGDDTVESEDTGIEGQRNYT